MKPRNGYGVGLLPDDLAEKIAKGMTTADDVLAVEQVIANKWHDAWDVGHRAGWRSARVAQEIGRRRKCGVRLHAVSVSVGGAQ